MSDADLDKIARRIQSRHHTTMMGEPVHDEDRMLAEIRRLRAALTPPPPRTKKGPPQGPLGCRWVTIIDLPSGEHLACVSIDGAQRYVDGQWRVETDPVVAVLIYDAAVQDLLADAKRTAEQMRERAAKVADDHADMLGVNLGAAIRALPTEPST
jgi:hypothetical protein